MKQVLFLCGLYLSCAADNGEATEKENVVDELGCLAWAIYTTENVTECVKMFEEACEKMKTSSPPPTLQPGDDILNQESTEEEEDSLMGGNEDYMSNGEVNTTLDGERDENGCLQSGGYAWCDKQNDCVRSSELEGDWEDECVAEAYAAKSSVQSNEEGSVVGEVRDENGCLGSAGYTWCEKQNKCVRSWELQGEWEDECVAETTASSYGGNTKFFFNEDGTVKPWVFSLVLAVIATLLFVCLIRRRRMRKRRQRIRSASILLSGYQNNDARFNADRNNVIYQETMAVQDATKNAVPSPKEFSNFV